MNNKNLIAASVLGLALAASPLLASANDIQSMPAMPSFDKTMVSINISNNGSVLVRGAKVTDISGSAVTAQTTVNGVTMTWDISTDSSTSFVNADGSTASVGGVSDGDYVSFSGMLTGELAVNADTLRDWSVDEVATPQPAPIHWPWYHLDQWPVFSFFAHAKAGVNSK